MENLTMVKVAQAAMVDHLYGIFNMFDVRNFLGGSKRFLGTETNSDWDFFVFVPEDKRERFYKFLEDVGLYEKMESSYFGSTTKQYYFRDLFHITCFSLYGEWLNLEEEHRKIDYAINSYVGKNRAIQLHKYLKTQGLKGKDFYRIIKLLFL